MTRVATASAFVGFALLLPACVHGSEGIVRDRAAAEFGCADYALSVEEIGPDVFRASGCGQELIYACQRGRVRAGQRGASDPDGDDFADQSGEAPIVCARRLR